MSCPYKEEENLLYDELECKICYQRYNAQSRKPKILDCLHRVCAICLAKMSDVGVDSHCINCPFCRHETQAGEGRITGLPDDTNIMARLTDTNKSGCNSDCSEVVLASKNLASYSPSHGSSNCVVITIMELQSDLRSLSHNTSLDYYGSCSLDSLSIASHNQTGQDIFSKLCNHIPRIFFWLLGLFHFGSLPLGIYLLVIQKVTLGIICVSLVPSSLTVCLVYGFWQCLCKGMCECTSRS
ncbi:E3 ubiquitin-protein ligase RNF182-like [Protopterus annectens]|uniref:E3 ubiquitin-protein ligase RNF182-like n=1 Tax=Protopterus annectens TaxID=7888 RepID=UPI001CF95AAE|nr:E3 ubiquitin-protein ligase RNF182-like [Protopterus annectens]